MAMLNNQRVIIIVLTTPHWNSHRQGAAIWRKGKVRPPMVTTSSATMAMATQNKIQDSGPGSSISGGIRGMGWWDLPKPTKKHNV